MIRVQSVEPVQGFTVLVEFTNGEKRTIDLEPFLRGSIFASIRNDSELFLSMHVDPELKTIVWPNGADIDPDVLYGKHQPVWKEPEDVSAT